MLGRTKRDCEKDRSEDRGREVTGLDEQKKKNRGGPNLSGCGKGEEEEEEEEGRREKKNQKEENPALVMPKEIYKLKNAYLAML